MVLAIHRGRASEESVNYLEGQTILNINNFPHPKQQASPGRFEIE
jgi:hypothetical protein